MSRLGPNRPARHTPRPLESQRAGAVAAACACLAIAVYLTLNQRDQSHVRTASDLGRQGLYLEAAAEARTVTRGPADSRALLIRAQAAQALGRHRTAVRFFSQTADRDPRNWSVRRDWAISLLALGDRRAAVRQLDLASALNPRLEPPPGF